MDNIKEYQRFSSKVKDDHSTKLIYWRGWMNAPCIQILLKLGTQFLGEQWFVISITTNESGSPGINKLLSLLIKFQTFGNPRVIELKLVLTLHKKGFLVNICSLEILKKLHVHMSLNKSKYFVFRNINFFYII